MTRTTGSRVRRWGADAQITAVIRQEAAAGRSVHVVPAGDDKAETLQLFAEVLRFPAYFGHNLDALADSLGDYAARQRDSWTLVWDGTRFLRAADPATFDAIVAVLDDVAADHPQMHAAIVER
ncbi:MAG: barstar family protein [Dermatophilaceae bacterium]